MTLENAVARVVIENATIGYDKRIISRDLSVQIPGRVVHRDHRDRTAAANRLCCGPSRAC